MDDKRTLAERLCAARLNMSNPLKAALNGHFKSKYVTLDVLIDAVVPHLNAEGLTVVQEPGFADGCVTLRTVLLAPGEERDCGTLAVPLASKGNPNHAVGSSLTYMRRYALEAVAGVCGTADDDGNGHGAQQRPPPGPSPLAAAVKAAGITAKNAPEVMAFLQAKYNLPQSPNGDDKLRALTAFGDRHGIKNTVDAAREWAAQKDAT